MHSLTPQLPDLSTSPMVVVRSKRRPSARAFEIFRAHVIERETQASIAKRYGVNQQRVSFLVMRVTRWAREHQGIGDALAIKVEHTSILYDLYREAREQWKRSCSEVKTTSVVSVSGRVSKDGDPLPEQKTTRIETKGQSGNSSLMRAMDELLASIRGIWGADAPKQVDLSSTDEHHIAVVTIPDRLALAIEEIDRELARRGVSIDA